MKIQIEVKNDVERNKAISGSIYIDEDGNANFRVWNRNKRDASKRYRKLEHGRVSVDSKKTRLCVTVNHDEMIDAATAFSRECSEANNWLIMSNLNP